MRAGDRRPGVGRDGSLSEGYLYFAFKPVKSKAGRAGPRLE